MIPLTQSCSFVWNWLMCCQTWTHSVLTPFHFLQGGIISFARRGPAPLWCGHTAWSSPWVALVNIYSFASNAAITPEGNSPGVSPSSLSWSLLHRLDSNWMPTPYDFLDFDSWCDVEWKIINAQQMTWFCFAILQESRRNCHATKKGDITKWVATWYLFPSDAA